MSLNVITNYAANVAHRYLVDSDAAAGSSLSKLASGQRVVTAKDDAASLAIGSRLSAQVQALRQANVNAVQATSMLQIADGAMSKVSDILIRLKTLAVQAGSGQLSNTERNMLNTEYQALLSEVERIAQATEFNGVHMVAGVATTATSLNAQPSAKNFVEAADGFQAIKFDSNVTSTSATTAVFTFAYDSASNVLTATNKTTGTSQGVNIGSASIGVNVTQTVTFGNLGVVVDLNSAFNKSANIVPTAANTFTSQSVGQIETATIALNSINAAAIGTVTNNVISVDASGGAATATLKLTNTISGTANLSTTGTKTVTLSDTNGASFNISINVLTAFGTGDNAAQFTVGDLGAVVLGTNTTSNTTFSFKLGTGNVANVDTISITVDSITSQALGLSTSNISTQTNADNASGLITTALDTLNVSRANIGAAQNRLNFAQGNLSITVENMEAARSNLLDLDIAAEMTTFTGKQILEQTGIAMLAQANQLPEHLLRLFQ